MADLYVSVNLSGAQLHDELIVERVAEVLTVNGLDGIVALPRAHGIGA